MTFPSLNIEKLRHDTIQKVKKEKQDKELTHCHILLRVPKFLKNKIKKLVRIIEKHLPPLFSVRLTKRTQQISVKYPTKRTHELNDNFDVY